MQSGSRMFRGSSTFSGRRRQEELVRRPSAAQAYTPSWK